MKPLTLSLTGFRSYPNPVTVDFTGKTLVAALGDTGAGKSSLLEAITFALFGRSSWDGKASRQLITDGASAMSVELLFLHNDERWQVHRTSHATNPNAGRHHLNNLDTGEEADGATIVNSRIKTLLHMDDETFLRTALLPQGRFDRLLVATMRERSKLLRELFGADSLETVRAQADRQLHSVEQLMAVATVKRDTMPANPEKTANDARLAAETAEAIAGRLDSTIAAVKVLQKQASQAETAATAARTQAQTLSTLATTDAEAVLNRLEPVAAQIADRRNDLDRRATDAASAEGDLTSAIESADRDGEGLAALGQAAALLENLAARTEEQRTERDRLAATAEQLAAEATDTADAQKELAVRTSGAEPLTTAAASAADLSAKVRSHVSATREAVAAAATAARHVADATQAQSTAEQKRDELQVRIAPAKQHAEEAQKELTAAQTLLESLRSRDRAAEFAADLHPGDGCPVCQRTLPDDFEPVSKAGTAAIRKANTRLHDAQELLADANTRVAKAKADLAAAQTSIKERETACRKADSRAKQAADIADTMLQELSSSANIAVPNAQFDTAAAQATLQQAIAVLTTSPADDEAATDLAASIITALIEHEQAAASHAEQLHTKAAGHTAAIAADGKALAQRKRTYERGLADKDAANKRNTAATGRLTAAVESLPSRFRQVLPAELLSITAAEADAAAAQINARTGQVQKLINDRERARADAAEISRLHRALEQEETAAIDRPLSQLRASLYAWSQAAQQAASRLKNDQAADIEVPRVETHLTDIGDLRLLAAALSTTTAELDRELQAYAARCASRAADAVAALGEHARNLSGIEGLDASIDLINPDALIALGTTVGRVKSEAARRREEQKTAQEQIRPAADLDFAITAGQTRLDTLSVLRRELVDAKFLGHLTTLRTRALLGFASDLLGQMSDDQFGFAETFDIVSRGSGVEHHPNRLSGGEKFLASLALALALAEMHSRGGTRLGSLFLDEGFAALDTTTLDAALEVLRAQAGGDRLVMVISHLHAIAEEVDDVLWVERAPTGSTARWLTQEERDELVQADLASGLQTLT
ncbi:AAA family ATPase [Catenulispora pinisilvae]|uniref:AAA family ATPase n=1 Tax=Catenulispora pinisilvae TaxID=2705253 RepID=UPI0018924AF5|nr:SMC family ATPase [Catenulispora pinisilvae]